MHSLAPPQQAQWLQELLQLPVMATSSSSKALQQQLAHGSVKLQMWSSDAR
jgi:hypothetical protein